MLENFSDRRRVLLWRDLWIALAQAERDLGLPISQPQVDALRAAREDIDFARVAELEAKSRHDVMAHVHHFGEVAGADAAKIIHLGATSCFVTDNAELVMIRAGLELVMDRLVAALNMAGYGVRLVVEVGRVTDSPARRNAAAAAEQQLEAEKIVFDDPLVQTLMRDFGAKIVPGSIKPL